jgi:hypothetical protein
MSQEHGVFDVLHLESFRCEPESSEKLKSVSGKVPVRGAN